MVSVGINSDHQATCHHLSFTAGSKMWVKERRREAVTYEVADSHIKDPAVPPALIEVWQHVLKGQLHELKTYGQDPEQSMVPNDQCLHRSSLSALAVGHDCLLYQSLAVISLFEACAATLAVRAVLLRDALIGVPGTCLKGRSHSSVKTGRAHDSCLTFAHQPNVWATTNSSKTVALMIGQLIPCPSMYSRQSAPYALSPRSTPSSGYRCCNKVDLKICSSSACKARAY